VDDDETPEPGGRADDSAETVPCPYCHRPVYEEAERCPHCEQYLTEEDRPVRPPWLVAGAFLCLLVALGWALGC
jgi:hypothetical protein